MLDTPPALLGFIPVTKVEFDVEPTGGILKEPVASTVTLPPDSEILIVKAA